MTQMSGTVKAVRKDNGGFLLTEADQGENWYSAPFKTKLPANIVQGAEVAFTFKLNGDYRNIDKGTLKLSDTPLPDNVPSGNSTDPVSTPNKLGKMFPVGLDTKDHVIMRQSALAAASNVAYHVMPDGATAGDVIALAEQFVRWTTGHSSE